MGRGIGAVIDPSAVVESGPETVIDPSLLPFRVAMPGAAGSMRKGAMGVASGKG
jgi:hypothetical protein